MIKDNVKLACVKQLDSVQSEPSSNSMILRPIGLEPII